MTDHFRSILASEGLVRRGGGEAAQDDFSRDRLSDLADFNILAANFGQSPRDFTQGDFTYDGTVNLADFNVLAGRFGTILSPATRGTGAFGGGRIGLNDEQKADLLIELLG